MIKKISLIIIFIFANFIQVPITPVYSQDFESNVSLNAVKLPEEVRFDYLDLPQKLSLYMDNYDWSNEELPYSIELNVNIFFEQIYRGYEDAIRARFIVSTNTGIQYADKEWRFPYKKGDLIDHNNPEFSPFLGLIDYYLYIIIGDEMDMLGEHLGTPFYRKADEVCNLGKFSRYPWWWDKRQEKIRYILSEEHKPFRSMLAYFNLALYELETDNRIDALKFGLEAIKILESIIDIYEEQEFCEDFLNRNYREFNKLASIPGGEIIKETLIKIDPEHEDYYIKNE